MKSMCKLQKGNLIHTLTQNENPERIPTKRRENPLLHHKFPQNKFN